MCQCTSNVPASCALSSMLCNDDSGQDLRIYDQLEGSLIRCTFYILLQLEDSVSTKSFQEKILHCECTCTATPTSWTC